MMAQTNFRSSDMSGAGKNAPAPAPKVAPKKVAKKVEEPVIEAEAVVEETPAEETE